MSSPPPSEPSSDQISPGADPAQRLARRSLLLALCSLVIFAAPFIAIVLIGKLSQPWSFLLFPALPLAVPWLPALLAVILGHMSRAPRRREGAGGSAQASRETRLETTTRIALALGYTVLALNLVGLGLALVIVILLS
jgi:hypothetical protein